MDNREQELKQAMTNAINDAIMDVLLAFAPDEYTRNVLLDLMEIMVRNGVPIATGSRVDKVSYRDYSSASSRDDRPARTRSGYSYDDVILDTRGEAEEVLTRMDELIETYGVVSVADLYDLVGVTCNYTDNKYGWTNIRNAEPIRVRKGYMLKLPKAIPIE